MVLNLDLHDLGINLYSQSFQIECKAIEVVTVSISTFRVILTNTSLILPDVF